MSPKGVVELIRGSEYGSTIRKVPDYIARDFDDIRAAVQNMYDEIMMYVGERLRAMYAELGDEASRKDYAMWIAANVQNSRAGFVFGVMDGKDISDKIWKRVIEEM
jgi:hypothetical protein